jgi:hypothetical protein
MLCAGGILGAVVEVHEPDAFMVEFVAAPGQTQPLVTLGPADVTAVADDDLVSVRPLVAKASRTSPPASPAPPRHTAQVRATAAA